MQNTDTHREIKRLRAETMALAAMPPYKGIVISVAVTLCLMAIIKYFI